MKTIGNGPANHPEHGRGVPYQAFAVSFQGIGQMANLIFITGGCRSGKSTFALKLAEEMEGPRTFLATCPVLDDEMASRIEKHRAERSALLWYTLETPYDLGPALSHPDSSRVYLLDCLSLWVNNLMYRSEQEGHLFSEHEAIQACEELLAVIRPHDYTLIVVSNEVGMGIVPNTPLGRCYRDVLGRANQFIAQASNSAYFMVSGIPLKLKE